MYWIFYLKKESSFPNVKKIWDLKDILGWTINNWTNLLSYNSGVVLKSNLKN